VSSQEDQGNRAHEHRGPGLRILAAPPSPELADLVEASLEANLKFPISLELPHVPVALIESVTDGVPLVLQKPSSDWGQRISALAGIATDPTGAAESRRPKSGFLGLSRG
jgi:hypothetical protein